MVELADRKIFISEWGRGNYDISGLRIASAIRDRDISREQLTIALVTIEVDGAVRDFKYLAEEIPGVVYDRMGGTTVNSSGSRLSRMRPAIVDRLALREDYPTGEYPNIDELIVHMQTHPIYRWMSFEGVAKVLLREKNQHLTDFSQYMDPTWNKPVDEDNIPVLSATELREKYTLARPDQLSGPLAISDENAAYLALRMSHMVRERGEGVSSVFGIEKPWDSTALSVVTLLLTKRFRVLPEDDSVLNLPVKSVGLNRLGMILTKFYTSQEGEQEVLEANRPCGCRTVLLENLIGLKRNLPLLLMVKSVKKEF